MELPQKICGEI